jgi:hypothetical protein
VRAGKTATKLMPRGAVRVVRGGILAAAFLAGVIPFSCGGRSRHPSPASGGEDPTGGAGESAGGNGATAAGGNAMCLPTASPTGCKHYSDCCSGICWFSLWSTYDDAGKPVPSEEGICGGDCKPPGAACTGDSVAGCCSGFCTHTGHCACGSDACTQDSDCCSGFCYRERSSCLATRCDPRLVPGVDPEACWRRLL